MPRHSRQQTTLLKHSRRNNRLMRKRLPPLNRFPRSTLSLIIPRVTVTRIIHLLTMADITGLHLPLAGVIRITAAVIMVTGVTHIMGTAIMVMVDTTAAVIMVV